MAALIFVVVPISLWCRISLERKVWPRGPSLRALLAAYYYSTLVIYVIDMVLIVVKGPFDSDYLGNTPAFVIFIGVGLLLMSLLGRSWVRSMYCNDPNFSAGCIETQKPEQVEPR